MKRGSVIKSGSLCCKLPLAQFDSFLLAQMENKTNRILGSPTAPAIFYNKETLTTVGLLNIGDPLSALIAAPNLEFGKANSVARAMRVAMITDPEAFTDEGRALYLAAYHTNNLDTLGVHLYGSGISEVAGPNPLASITALKTSEIVELAYTVNGSSGIGTDKHYTDWDVALVPGGVVYLGFAAEGSYTFGVQGSGVPVQNQNGYATVVDQFKAGAGAFDPNSITGYTEYASAEFSSPGGHTRRQIFLATDKAAADLPLAQRVAARCEKFQYTFWTLDSGVDVDGHPVPGDPSGVPAALGIDAIATRKTLAGSSAARDISASISDICADIATFFS